MKIKADAGIANVNLEIKKREERMKLLPLSGNSGEKIYLVMTEELLNKVQNIQTVYKKVSNTVKGCEYASKAGRMYRDGMVLIGSESRVIHVPAKPEDLSDMMEQLFSFLKNTDLDVILKAFVLHFYFIYLHPFCDGNGRTARVWTASYLYHHGYEKQGQKYLDITPFVSYMLEMFEKRSGDISLQ